MIPPEPAVPPSEATPSFVAAEPAAPQAAAPDFDRRMLEHLVCPVTRAPLAWDAEKQELISRAAHLAFPVRGGIPVMLVSEAREID